MIAIIDYGAGNLRSVQKAFEYLNLPVVISNQAEEIRSASHVILPGVGAFGDAMRELQSSGMDQVVRNVIADGKPFLGICVGLQLLFEESDESPGIKGLGIFRGKIRKIPGHGLKIPQMGWNSLHFHRTSPLLQGLREGAFMYFVHPLLLIHTGRQMDEPPPTVTQRQTRQFHDGRSAKGGCSPHGWPWNSGVNTKLKSSLMVIPPNKVMPALIR